MIEVREGAGVSVLGWPKRERGTRASQAGHVGERKGVGQAEWGKLGQQAKSRERREGKEFPFLFQQFSIPFSNRF